jgi:hypothetical protein
LNRTPIRIHRIGRQQIADSRGSLPDGPQSIQ